MTDTRQRPASRFPPAEPESGVRLKVVRLPVSKPIVYGECLAGGLGDRVPCPFVDCEHHLEMGGETCVLAVVGRNPDGMGFREVGALLGVSHARIEQIERALLRRKYVVAMLRAWAGERTPLVRRPQGHAATVLRKIQDCPGATRLELLDWFGSGLRRKREDVSAAIARLLVYNRVEEDEDGCLWAKGVT